MRRAKWPPDDRASAKRRCASLRPPITPLLLGLLALPGCPSPSDGNPKVLWLAPDMNETHVKLVDSEPHPF